MMEREQGLTAATLVLLFSSCSDPTTWSAPDCRSPDGSFIAGAHTVEHSGFGTGGVETIVELRRAGASGSPERVLAFADGGDAIHLQIRWDSPTHLSVVYDSDPRLLYYQVVKTSGVEISAQDLPAGQRHREEASRPP